MILTAASMPVLGTTWTAILDCAGLDASGMGGLAVLEVRPVGTSGTVTPFGEVLVSGALLYRTSRVYSTSPTLLTCPIPYNLRLYGLQVHVQGFCRGPTSTGQKVRTGRASLTNGVDLVLGF
jgi:hypothetical protein